MSSPKVTVAAPREWTWWERLNFAWFVVAFVGGFAMRDGRLGGVAISIFGVIQLYFGRLLALNHRDLADRMADYFRHRSWIFGGTGLNRSPRIQRVQGGALVAFGIACVVIGAWVATR